MFSSVRLIGACEKQEKSQHGRIFVIRFCRAILGYTRILTHSVGRSVQSVRPRGRPFQTDMQTFSFRENGFFYVVVVVRPFLLLPPLPPLPLF